MMIGLFKQYRRRRRCRRALATAQGQPDVLTKCTLALEVLSNLELEDVFQNYTPAIGQNQVMEMHYHPIEQLRLIESLVDSIIADKPTPEAVRKKEVTVVAQTLDDWLFHNREVVLLRVYTETLVKILQPLVNNLADARLCRHTRYSYYARVANTLSLDLVQFARVMYDLEVTLHGKQKRRP